MLQPYVLCKIALILGPPGTGKTYTCRGLIRKILSGVGNFDFTYQDTSMQNFFQFLHGIFDDVLY